MSADSSELLNPYSEIESGFEDVLYSHASDSAAHYSTVLTESSGSWNDVLEASGEACGAIDDNCYLGREIRSVLEGLENPEPLAFKSEEDEFYVFIGRASSYVIDDGVRKPEYLVGELRSWDSGCEDVPDWRIRAESRTPSFLERPLERPKK